MYFLFFVNFLAQGKVKVVSENYTTSYTCPSPGYDCHVAVSRNNIPSKTSHCQAFEQSQVQVCNRTVQTAHLQATGEHSAGPGASLVPQRVFSSVFPFSPQYYVYEVSDGSTAERPRQICPYIVISCQYREPKEMPVLAIENL